MTNQHTQAQLFFNFADKYGNTRPLLFEKPVHIIEALHIEEVIPAFQAVQAAVADGFYAAGFLAYEAAPAFQSTLQTKTGANTPLLWFGIYEKPLEQELETIPNPIETKWEPNVSISEYHQQLHKILHDIQNGLTKQVNYTIKMKTEFHKNPKAYFQQLAQAQAANYTAYLDIGDFTILSASPELFFRMEEGYIVTKPMAGTIARGKTHEEDVQNHKWLQESEKIKFENEVIVEVMKSELQKIAKAGHVEVPVRYEIEKYPTVYQMTSTVSAKLADDLELIDVFRALFPCGSITGFPKDKTMRIIAELEKEPREVYCGAIGFISPDNQATFNVPIRTVLLNNQTKQATYGVGGGITSDSDPDEEYREVLAKAEILTKQIGQFQLLETLRLEDGNYFLLDLHVKRLINSADYYHFHCDLHQVKDRMKHFAIRHADGAYKVRLLIDSAGKIDIQGSRIDPEQVALQYVKLAKTPITSSNTFLYHKTTNRNIYEEKRKHQPGCYDVLLWNETREATEFTNGNLVVELNSNLYTPPVSSGLLAGTYREHLLTAGVIQEKVITLEDLSKATAIWFINSVRKWVPVQFSD
ncbi:aminodeoxychorismate synthase, component I [Ornithinibacillus gellani]|uniref:chorismate-binding protein n=1 Tax=Ornithinibacillus gellani TaxID=2293253 RepID=UPI000F47DF5C|nr:chorismate-binding protein [Ornithinibacillus gellani]TQS70653.1 aminodeoxychorismate synthase, component I [Ornithinibacillus gellani]